MGLKITRCALYLRKAYYQKEDWVSDLLGVGGSYFFIYIWNFKVLVSTVSSHHYRWSDDPEMENSDIPDWIPPPPPTQNSTVMFTVQIRKGWTLWLDSEMLLCDDQSDGRSNHNDNCCYSLLFSHLASDCFFSSYSLVPFPQGEDRDRVSPYTNKKFSRSFKYPMVKAVFNPPSPSSLDARVHPQPPPLSKSKYIRVMLKFSLVTGYFIKFHQ